MKTGRRNRESLDEIEVFVRRRFRDLSMPEHALYFDSLRVLEKKNGGPFKQIVKPEGTWARESGATRPTVREWLRSLHQRGLIHLRPGSNGSDGNARKRNVVSRCTIEEITTGVDAELLHRFVPANVDALVERWNKHGVPWNGGIIKPRWNVTITGRLSHGNSPLTAHGTNTKAYRLRAFRRSLRPDEVLVETDWTAAEPTVLCHALHERGFLPKPVDPATIYEAIQQDAGCTRKQAKGLFQSIVYSPYNLITVLETWKLPANHFLHGLVGAVQEYRVLLYEHGKPRNGKARFVHTLTGREIVVPRSRRMHGGTVLSWQLQGTVADIFAQVVAHVLDDEAKGLCRFFFPCHDAVYVAVNRDSTCDPAAIMDHYAELAGIPLRTKTKTHRSPRATQSQGRRRG